MSKDAHPDAGGSLDRFTELQLARTELLQAVGSDDGPKVYFGTNERGREVGVIDRAPLWLPGAMATLVLGIISLVVGVTQVDRTVLAAGLLTAVAVGIAITGLLAIRRSRRTRR